MATRLQHAIITVILLLIGGAVGWWFGCEHGYAVGYDQCQIDFVDISFGTQETYERFLRYELNKKYGDNIRPPDISP